MIVGLDASRNRSGGAIIHVKGILQNFTNEQHGIEKVHLWSYKGLLDQIPDYPWLIKHCPVDLKGNIIQQLYWQRFKLPKLLKSLSCTVLLSTDAGTVCRFFPSVVMSRDMLSYEPGMMSRFGLFSKSRLRLTMLRYMQNTSLRKAYSAVFLTNYASDIIQQSCGKLKNVSIIPHGVSTIFADVKKQKKPSLQGSSAINIIYVSNAAPYKNQLQVIEAIDKLIIEGYPIQLELIGGGDSIYLEIVDKFIDENVVNKQAIYQLGRLEHKELSSKLGAADIFLFASCCENMPNTLVEGMSTGLPIVCSNKGPMPEVLEKSGIYFDPNDVISIVEAVKKMIINDELRNQLAESSRQLVKQYSWSRCSDETFKLLSQVGKRGL